MHLIAPEQMAGVLEEVLLSSRDVRFIALKGLGATALLESPSTQAGSDPVVNPDTELPQWCL